MDIRFGNVQDKATKHGGTTNIKTAQKGWSYNEVFEYLHEQGVWKGYDNQDGSFVVVMSCGI